MCVASYPLPLHGRFDASKAWRSGRADVAVLDCASGMEASDVVKPRETGAPTCGIV